MRTLRAGVVGLGVGEAHIRGYLDEGIEVVALCDRNENHLNSVADKYPSVKHRFLEARNLLCDPTIDIISIASFDEDHAEQVIIGLSHHKHLFVEKPLCTSLSQARSIREALSRSPQSRISSNLILRHSPRFQQIRSMIRAGEFGQLFHVEGDYLYGRFHKLTEGWRGDYKDYSVTVGGGVHLVDLLLWLTGDTVESVSAVGTSIASKGSKVKFPDTVTAILSFKSGMTGTVSSNFACVHPHFHRVNVFGTKATFQNDLDVGRLFRERGSSEFSTVTTPYKPSGKELVLREFIRSIKGDGQASAVQIDEVFHALSVCFAIDAAVESGTRVNITSI